MIELESFYGKNIVYFKDVEFKFENGLTFIKGRNKQRTGPTASNGSGKSLLFGILPNLIHDSHPVITKNARSVQKQLYGKGSKAGVTFKSNSGSRYTYNKAGTKTELIKGKKNMMSRMARDTMKKLIDISEEEFYSTVYIDSSRMNNFQRGTSADRFAFITNLFRLHDMDALRKQFKRELNELRSDSNIAERVVADLAEAQSQLKSLPSDAEAEAEAISRKLRKANKLVSEADGQLLRHETYAKYLKVQQQLAELATPKFKLKELKQQLREIQEYQAAAKEYKRQKQQSEELRTELDKLRGQVSKRDLANHDQMLDVQRRIMMLDDDGTESIDKPDEPDLPRARAERLAKDHPTEKVSRLRDLNRNLIKQHRDALTEFDKALAHETECPTCYSGLSAETKKAVRKSLQSKLDEVEEKVNRYTKILEACRARDQWKAYDKRLAEYKEYKHLKDQIKGYPFEQIERIDKLEARLRDIAPTKPVTPKYDDEEKIEAQIEQWSKHEHLNRLEQSLRTEAPTMTEAEAKTVKVKQSELVNKYMQRLPKLQAQAELYKQAKRRVKELTTESAQLQQRLEDLPVYEMLADAYSASGIKLLMVKRIGAALEENLNRYSKQVYSENFTFKVIIDNNQFDIMVNRTTAKGQITSDIRHLSGAEGRLFVFLQLLAELPLLPSHRRMNVMIMDEPSANMDNPSREILRDVLFPLLQQIVPCLIVISPDEALAPQHCRTFTVVKDGGSATLEKGDVK